MDRLSVRLNRPFNNAPFFSGARLGKSQVGLFLLSLNTSGPINLIYHGIYDQDPLTLQLELFSDSQGDLRMTELLFTIPAITGETRLLALKSRNHILIVPKRLNLRDIIEKEDVQGGHRIICSRHDDTAFVIRPGIKRQWPLIETFKYLTVVV